MSSTNDITFYKSNIVKCSDGKYKIDYSYKSPDGVRHRTCKRGFERKKDAMAWQRETLPSVIKRMSCPVKLDEDLTMKELIDEYMKFSQIRRRSSTNGTKENIVKTKIMPYFNKQRVFAVSKNDIRKWQDQILSMRKSDGEPYSVTYIRTINNQLSAILNYAVQYHNLSVNPVLQIERIGSKQPETERAFWTLEEYERFSDTIKDQPIYYYSFQVLFWCGIRIGELMALTKKDIDLSEGAIHIRNSYSKDEGINGKTKTKNSLRVVHMPQELTEEIRDYMDSIYRLRDNEQLFPVSKTQLHRIMTEGSQAAGVKRITLHGLRHSHISLLMNYVSCASVMDIAKRAGHKSPDVTMIYAHRYSNKDEVIAQELDSMMKGGQSNVG